MKYSYLLFTIGPLFIFAFLKVLTKEGPAEISFRKEVVHSTFISEGVACADLNNDGLKDIVAGHYWFEAPSWKIHEVRTPETFDYTKGYSHSFLNFCYDIDQDGWQDFICFDFPGEGVYWYRNPGESDKHWEEFLIDSNACNESPMFIDLDGDDQMDLIFGRETTGEMVWYEAPKNNKNLQWTETVISFPGSKGTDRYSHGLGADDVNGDGRKDIIIREGWWEAPTKPHKVKWTFHAKDLGEPCSQMYARDIDGDGDADILSASAHAYGIWWHEQVEGGFKRHLIDTSFSQTHGVAMADLNGDGVEDFITGKRFFAHQGKDPGGLEPPVIFWYEKKAGEATWHRHMIDDDSGAGLQVVIEDIDGNGKLDILNSNKKGVIIFYQE